MAFESRGILRGKPRGVANVITKNENTTNSSPAIECGNANPSLNAWTHILVDDKPKFDASPVTVSSNLKPLSYA